jgi:hypothetical protein
MVAVVGARPVPDSAIGASAGWASVRRVSVAELGPCCRGPERRPIWQLSPGATGCWQRSLTRWSPGVGAGGLHAGDEQRCVTVVGDGENLFASDRPLRHGARARGEDGARRGYVDLEPRAVQLRAAARTLLVASLEDIIASKQHADRAKDRDAPPELYAAMAGYTSVGACMWWRCRLRTSAAASRAVAAVTSAARITASIHMTAGVPGWFASSP